MPTILAVDDSATMRKAYEITFKGTEFDLAVVAGFDEALQSLEGRNVDLVLADASLEPRSGYELCEEIKKRFSGTAVMILASTQTPFDASKGSSADDHIDKPFDTQALIDKAKRLCGGGDRVSDGSRPASPTSAPSAVAPSPSMAPAPAAPPAPPMASRSPTLSFTPGVGIPSAPPRGGVSAPPMAPKPSAIPAAPPAPSAVATMAMNFGMASASVGGMAAKLPDLGLTPSQIEAVMALSKDVVERVVWEVVPMLAETLIKEEIARLTKSP